MTLPGTWLVVAPAGSAHEALIADCRRALTGHGARVLLAEIPAGEVDRSALAERIAETLRTATENADDAPAVTGIVSLLALDESPWPNRRSWPPAWPGPWAWSRPSGTPGSVRRCGC
ncbi:hypothetical protein [Thermocatellispora tengchongensis]|uniref:hypothetical protein n=1 Tax=Thermocatellispora tengchongensis TaxID=1073253 RepID=UPI00363979E8